MIINLDAFCTDPNNLNGKSTQDVVAEANKRYASIKDNKSLINSYVKEERERER